MAESVNVTNKQSWPAESEILAAMADEANYVDSFIKGRYKCRTVKRRGQFFPVYASGGYTYAFEMEPKQGDLPLIYYRVFHKICDFKTLNKRYLKFYEFLSRHKDLSKYFVKSSFELRALNVNGFVLPGSHIRHVKGTTLGRFLRNLQSSLTPGSDAKIKRDMASLATEFKEMMLTLYQYRVSHGDLSCDNIMVTPDLNICLIDYDSVYIPAMGDVEQVTCGYSAFQHPKRPTLVFSTSRDDDFSSLVIYVFLLGLSHDLSLLDICGDSELFDSNAFTDQASFKASRAYVALSNIHDKEIDMLLDKIFISLAKDVCDVPSLASIYLKSLAPSKPQSPQPTVVVKPDTDHSEIDALRAQVASLQARLNEQTVDFASKADAMRHDIVALREANAKLSSELDRMVDMPLDEEAAKVTQGLLKKIDTLTATLTALKKENSSLADKNRNLTGESKMLRDTNVRMLSEQNNMKGVIDSLHKELNKYKNDSSNLTKRYNSLVEDNARLTKERDGLKAQLDSVTRAASGLQAQVTRLKKELGDAHESENNQAMEKLRLSNECSELKREVVRLKKALDAKDANVGAGNNASKISELEKINKQQLSYITSLRAEIKSLKAEIKKYKDKGFLARLFDF